MYRLLIVDDNVRERNGVAKLGIWQELGFSEIYTAINGQEGYEKAIEIKPTLVISDVSMPVMDGLCMAEKILKDIPNAKFIFVSCFDDKEYIRSAIDLNAFAYILKPISIGKLRESVLKILNISENEKKQERAIDELRSEIQKNKPIIREQIARDWIYGKLSGASHEKLLPFELDIKNFCAVVGLQINSLGETFETDGYLAVNKITRLLEGDAAAEYRNCFFVSSKREICILLYLDSTDTKSEAVNESIAYFEKIKTEINDETGLDISVYIGGITDNYDEIPSLFERADDFMRNGICAKGNSIIFLEESRPVENPDYDVVKLKNEIFTLIESGDSTQSDSFAEKYLSSEMSVFAVKKFVFTVISILQLVLFEMGENLKLIFDDEFFVWEKLEKYHSTDEIRNLLVNVLQFSAEYLQTKKTDRYMKTIEDIKRIIEEQYATLKSVDQIVAQTFFSAVHANVIFKKYTGCTIFDYLTQYKIEQAKKMLTTGNCKVYEVADFLGYKNKNYFTVLFKSYTGLTPRQYRDKISHEVKD